ncbi:MAG: DNA helicase RecQ [Oscillospiraceae bacterium]|nr:DNA helicase RecQ [Oscillospiraceae bacterium]
MDKYTALKEYFGHSQFRPGQEEIVEALLSGRDALGVMPTGAGKSVCYQLPALLLPGITLVLSPLISLMKDQVAALTQAGIPAAFVNSTLAPGESREIFRRAALGEYRLLYAAPERLAAPDFLRFIQRTELSLLAVDEAHCVSQWGQDFRPSYLKIAEFIQSLPRRPAVGAFTATATDQVKEDIRRLLLLEEPLCVTTGFDRPNLYFETIRPKNKTACLKQFLNERPGQSGIVYCATRKKVESVWNALEKDGISAARYHAGLPDEERRRSQEDFVYDRVRVMVATNAFGMGIDKSNVSFVVHYNMPKDVESYYQEAGRAGRDGSEARCILFFSEGDVQTAKYLINNSSENEGLTDKEREQLRLRDLNRLEQMTAYCRTSGCLRSFLLRYFGESAPEKCGRCGSCSAQTEQQDITIEAQKILSAVTRVERQYRSSLGSALILRLLLGSRDQRLLQLGLDKLPTYGIMRGTPRAELRGYMDWLLERGYLCLDGTDYPVLRTTPKAKGVLFRGEPVLCTRRVQSALEKETAPAVSGRRPSSHVETQADGDLLELLRKLRTRLASEGNVPAYIVFSNATLEEMAAKQPRTMQELMEVSGVGAVKARRYGEAFLSAISEWMGV